MPGPVARPNRLGSLKQRPAPKRQRGPAQARQQANAEKRCTNPTCGSTNLSEEDGYIICKECFTQIAESNIVSDVQFNEEAGGRATVQGASVAENSRHAKTLGAETFKRLGGGGRNSIAETERAGKRALAALCPKLGIAEDISVQAASIWNLAANINFSAGRKTDEVVAACLYAACRRRKDNAVLLMDIAELIKVNVFRLGEVYKDLCKNLYMAEESVGHQHLVDLEPLIYKYCQKLQFADKTNIVAEDALKIIRRMNRDWMVSGRHPAGLCGACIILAAKMNNFHRSVREVVYVSKVADVTIANRIQEFRRTKSAALSVDDFRVFGNRMKFQHDPPSMNLGERRAELMDKRKRKREEYRQSMARDSQDRQSIVEIPDNATDPSSRLSSLNPGNPAPGEEDQAHPQKRRRTEGPAAQPTPPATQQQTQLAAAPSTNAQPTNTQPTTAQPPTTHPTNLQPTITAPNTQPQFVPVNTPPQTQDLAKRKRDDNEDQSAAADDDNAPAKRMRTAEPETTTSAQATAPPQQTVRYDADGFAIPALPQVPIDPAITGEEAKPAKRGRKRKEDQPPEVVISEEELAEEDYLEKQIEAALGNDEVQESQTEVEKTKEEEALKRAQVLSEAQQKMDAEKTKARRDVNSEGNWFGPAPTGETVTAEELEKEFENDPEIERCILKPFEVEIKERIWVAHNEDWLRKQAEKELMAKVAGNQGKKRTKKGKEKTKKKRGKMGDGTVLTESSTPIETPADAARAMLEKRAPQKSAHVDFSALQRIYGRETPSRASSSTPEGSGSQTRDTTPAGGREPSATPAPTEPESQADEEAAASPGAEAGAEEEQVEDVDEGEEDEQQPVDQAARQVQPATWDTIGDDQEDVDEDVEDEGEDDYRRAIGMGEEMDEFGVVGGGYESEGEEYE